MWNGDRFKTKSIKLSEHVTHEVCVAAYALLIGVKGTSAGTVFRRIKVGEACTSAVPVKEDTEEDRLTRMSLHSTMIQQYVSNHIS